MLKTRVSQRLDAPVVFKTGAVKGKLFHSSGLGALGNQLADFAGGGNITGCAGTQGFVQSGSTGKHLAPARGNDLGINML